MRRRVALCMAAAALLCAVTLAVYAKGQGEAGKAAGEVEQLTISFIYWNCPPEPDEVFRDMEQMFNVKFNVIPTTYNENETKINALLAANEAPDIFYTNHWGAPVRYKKLIEEDVIRAIPDELINKYAQVKWLYSKIQDERWLDGKFYHFPKFSRKDDKFPGSQAGLEGRRDYMKALGITKDPETWEEFNTLLRRMAKDDPDKNGKNDTYGMTLSRNFHLTLLEQFGMRDWNYEGGKWVPGYISRAAKEGTKWLYGLLRDGILDPEFPVNTREMDQQKIATGKAGLHLESVNFQNCIFNRSITWDRAYPGRPIGEWLGTLKLPTGPLGKKVWSFSGYAGGAGNLFSAKVDDKKMDRILRIFDFLSTVDGYKRVVYGVEGKDYRVENNKLVVLRKPDAAGKALYSAQNPWGDRFRQLAIWNNDQAPDIRHPDAIDWDYEQDDITYKYYMPYVDKGFMWTRYILDPAFLDYNIRDFGQQGILSIITGTEDFETAWTKYVDRAYKELKTQAVIDLANAEARKRNINPKDFMVTDY